MNSDAHFRFARLAVFVLVAAIAPLARAQSTAAATAVLLDGSDDYVSAGAGINLANKSFSIEFWAKRAGAGTLDYVIGQGAAGQNAALHIGFRANNNFTFAFYGNDVDVAASYSDTAWHHWAATFDATSKQRIIYRDGTPLVTNTATANFQGSGDFTIGTALFTGSQHFNGQIDEVRVWTNVVRGASAVVADMKRRLAGTETGLAAYYRFDEGAGTAAADSSGHGYTATLLNGATWTTSAAPIGPIATTPSSSSPYANGATISSTVNPNGQSTSVSIEYGTTSSFGTSTSAQSIGAGTSAVAVTFNLAGLAGNTTYHYRLVASSSSGTAYGPSLTFTTTGLLPNSDRFVQSLTLQPGWNAVFVEVQPTNPLLNDIVRDTPIESVWTYNRRLSSVEFIQDTSEPLWNRDEWLAHFPTNQIESFQNNLFALTAQRPYLIKLSGAAAHTMQLTGRPSLRAAEWAPEAYNLRGFPIDPSAPPTFREFFRHSPAHFDSATGLLEPMFRLNASGNWMQVAPTDLMKSGEAYWVFTKGASDYAAPIQVTPAILGALDYGTIADELSLVVRNNTGSQRNATLVDLNAPSLLSYQKTDAVFGPEWIQVPTSLVLSNAAQANTTLRLAVRRADMTEAEAASLLQVTDGAGTRFLIPVTAEKFVPDASVTLNSGSRTGSARRASLHSDHTLADAKRYAGLWVGDINVTGVNEINSGDLATNATTGEITRTGVSTSAAPTRAEFNLRLILHVDEDGRSRLLREVIQLFRPATYTNNSDGLRVRDQAAQEVLVTQDNLLGQFQGGAIRDGELVGRRISSSTFDFDGQGTNSLPLTGVFGGNNTVSGAITLARNFPTNPFRHKFHPDHDNLGTDFASSANEAPEITRQFKLAFTPTPTGPPASSRSGSTVQNQVALTFDGVNDYVSVANVGSIVPTNEITVEIWQKVSSAKVQFSFGLVNDQTTNRISAHIPFSDGKVVWDFGNINTSGRLSYAPGTSIVGTWQHFAFVSSQSGNYMRIYRNGVLEAEKTGFGTFVRGTYDLRLGSSFLGELAEFRMWNVARSQSDILRNKDLPLSGSETGLLFYYRLSDASGASATDATVNGRTAALVNGPVWSTQPFMSISVPTADYGYKFYGGTYRETVTGLHRDPIVAHGTFLLRRVSTTAVLNQ